MRPGGYDEREEQRKEGVGQDPEPMPRSPVPSADKQDALETYRFGKPLIWLTWVGLRTKPETHQLVAVSLNSRHAYRARKALENQYEHMELPVRVWTEEREANHMYGYGMIAEAQRLSDQEIALEARLDTVDPQRSADDIFPDEAEPSGAGSGNTEGSPASPEGQAFTNQENA